MVGTDALKLYRLSDGIVLWGPVRVRCGPVTYGTVKAGHCAVKLRQVVCRQGKGGVEYGTAMVWYCSEQ